MAEREWAGCLAEEEVCLMILTTSFIGQPLQAEERKVVKREGGKLEQGNRKSGEMENERKERGTKILVYIMEIVCKGLKF